MRRHRRFDRRGGMGVVRYALTAAALACAAFGAAAATIDTALVASGFTRPLFAVAPLTDGRVFVVEKGGTIRVVDGGSVTPFLSLPVRTAGESGLLGLAFDPDYANPGTAGHRRFFVDYIDATTRDTVVASYRTADAGPLAADLSSRVEVLRIAQPAFDNHKAGWIGFKPGDANHLYIATGDGGGGYDPGNRAQNPASLLGKMLRVDINGDDFADANINYAVPDDNPFVDDAGTRGEIFALGLRNPFRNSFDRATGDLWIADVGQDAREEIDFLSAASDGGQNFGWRIREGDIATPGIDDDDPGGLVDPLLVYPHEEGSSVTGGYVVRDAMSTLDGQYVFGDFVSGRVWAIDAAGGAQTLADATELTAWLDAGSGGALGNIASFGEGADGALYIVDYGSGGSDGKVVRVVAVVPEPSSAALLLAGGGALWWLRRRRAAPVARPVERAER